ncbi:MAG TPA: aminopeptidase [Candidatus Binataceae bacterium]|nr:aminopeptidase [Candidatus Binataceae bacterium]
MRRLRYRLIGAAAIALCALGLAGCEIGYIARGAYEEARLLWHRKPISDELAQGDITPAARNKLEMVLQVRSFASDKLGLNVGGAYSTITPVDKGAITWVVMAAPKDSLTPHTWWFPIVGWVPYRGYFNESEARAEAEQLESEGYDTMVRSAVAFSSLGFFNDPLLSNLLVLDRVTLAGVIIHELFHRTYFLASDVMFDESAATYVGSRGAVDFFSATEGPLATDTARAREVFDSDLKFADFLLQEEARLLKLYHSGLSRDEILKQRVSLFAQIQADYSKLKPSLSGLERFDLDKQPLNNAVLINYRLYFHHLDDFAALERRYHGDLNATIKAIIAIAKANSNDPFYAIWQASQQTGSAPADR